ncbi:YeeE/YedE thiosulfate transporter family protein [Methanoregula sp.]|uniref:YeeE/YedE thiosulfate transporter family protein n=1 Tax=Methanoregula sp. TaxID=2052170 RepID=UPI0034457FCB
MKGYKCGEHPVPSRDSMIEWFTMASWSPYLAGAGIGVLIWTVFVLSDHPLGCSTGFLKTAGMVEAGLSGGKAKEMSYYRKFVPGIDWYWLLIIGIVIGAFLSSYLSGIFAVVAVPSFFAAVVGPDAVFRFAVALVGGILVGLGARWAGGCTSGHGISGTLQLSFASWVAAACFFISGILVAGLLFGFRFL